LCDGSHGEKQPIWTVRQIDDAIRLIKSGGLLVLGVDDNASKPAGSRRYVVESNFGIGDEFTTFPGSPSRSEESFWCGEKPKIRLMDARTLPVISVL